MSDTSQGPGWWRASDGLWYPPEARPGPRRPDGRDAETSRRPPGVPERPPADPHVQPPFTPRPVEPLEPVRQGRRGRRDDDGGDDDRRRGGWMWLMVALLVLAFAGAGTWLALTADDDTEDTAATTTVPTGTTAEPVTTTEAETTTTTESEVSAFELGVGDCFDAEPSGEAEGLQLTTVEIVECDEPHRAEVFEIVTLPEEPGAPFPGIEERDAEAQGLCQPAFGSYVGTPLAASELGLLWLAPTEESWVEQDDREVTCAVHSPDGEPLVGSVQGSQR